MKRSWRDKLDKEGLKAIEISAKLRRIKPPRNIGFDELDRWVKESNALFSANPDAGQKRKAKLDPKFFPIYRRTHPEMDLSDEELQRLLDSVELDILAAEKLELMQTIALALEGDQNKRIQAYEDIATMIVLLRRAFSGVLKKQLGTKPAKRFEYFWAIARVLDWTAETFRGNVRDLPGRVNVELASLTDAILEHQKQPLTQLELYEALKAAGAELPDDPEAFRLWLHRAKKQGLVKNLRSRNVKA